MIPQDVFLSMAGGVSNFKKWERFIFIKVLSSHGDVAESLRSGKHMEYADPVEPPWPSLSASTAVIERHKLILIPKYHRELNQVMEKRDRYAAQAKAAYSTISSYVTESSIRHARTYLTEWEAAEKHSDCLLLFLLLRKSHMSAVGDKDAFIATALKSLSNFHQGSLDFDTFINLYQDQIDLINEIRDSPLKDADILERFLPCVRGDIFKDHLRMLSLTNALPRTWELMKSSLQRFVAIQASYDALYESNATALQIATKVSDLSIRAGHTDIIEKISALCSFCSRKEMPSNHCLLNEDDSIQCRRYLALVKANPVLVGLSLSSIPRDGQDRISYSISIRALQAVHPSHSRGSRSKALTIDSGATINVVGNPKLLQNLHLISTPVLIHGVGKEPVSTCWEGELPYYGRSLYVEGFPRNIVAFKANKSSSYYDRELDKFVITHHDSVVHEFTPDKQGLYVCTPSRASRHSVHYGETLAECTVAERKRFDAAISLHQALDHPSDSALCDALDNGAYSNCTVTSKDVRDARKFMGPCVSCLRGKMKAASSPTSESEACDVIGDTLHADIIFIRGTGGKKLPYLLTVEHVTGFVLCGRLKSKRSADVIEMIRRVRAKYISFGWTVRNLRTDREIVFVSIEPAINEMGIRISFTAPDRHEKRTERTVDTIRSKARATQSGLLYKLPAKCMPYLITHVCSSHNSVPNERSGSSRTPRNMVTGSKINVGISLKDPFGTLAMFKCPTTDHETNEDSPRSECGIIIGKDFQSKGAVHVYLLNSGEIVTRQKYTVIPVTQEIIEKFDRICTTESAIEGPDISFDKVMSPPTSSTPFEDPVTDSSLSSPSVPMVPAVEVLESTPASVQDHLPSNSTANIGDVRDPTTLDPVNILPGGRSSRRANTAAVDYRRLHNSLLHMTDSEVRDLYHLSINQSNKELGLEMTKEATKNEIASLFEMNCFQPVFIQGLTPEEKKSILQSHMFSHT